MSQLTQPEGAPPGRQSSLPCSPREETRVLFRFPSRLASYSPVNWGTVPRLAARLDLRLPSRPRPPY